MIEQASLSELDHKVEEEQREFFKFISEQKNSGKEFGQQSAKDAIYNHLKVASPEQLLHHTFFSVLLWTKSYKHPYCIKSFTKDDFDIYLNRGTIPRDKLNYLFDRIGSEGDSHRREVTSDEDVMEIALEQSLRAETLVKLIDILSTKLNISISINDQAAISIDLEGKNRNKISKKGLLTFTSGTNSNAIFALFNNHPKPNFARERYLALCRTNINRIFPNSNIELI